MYLGFNVSKMKGLSLLPKTTSKTFHLARIHNASTGYQCVIFDVLSGPGCDQDDLDSNESGDAYTSPFKSVQLQVEVRTQNSSNNGRLFIPCVCLIPQQILKINKFDVVISSPANLSSWEMRFDGGTY